MDLTKNYFNTSHVTVYHIVPEKFEQLRKFQYISCYGLSFTKPSKETLKANFNTSHVTVYQEEKKQS